MGRSRKAVLFRRRDRTPRWLPAAMAINVLVGAGLAYAALEYRPAGQAHATPAGAAVRLDRVLDGDTLDVRTADGRSLRVRLSQVDAPEDDQPYGARSRAALQALVRGGPLALRDEGTDAYGRTLGTLHAADVEVNAELVRNGAAWAYRAYLRDRRLLAVENEARQAKRGLWAQPAEQIVEPWDWRRR